MHEGFWQVCPIRIRHHIIEDTVHSSAKVIAFDNPSHGSLVIICHHAAASTFAISQAKLTICALLPLNEKTTRLPFPFLNKNRILLKHRAVDFLRLPPSGHNGVLLERTAAVGTDVERPAMLLNLFHYFFRARPTVCPEAVDCNNVAFNSLIVPLQRILLVETHIGVALPFSMPTIQSPATATPGL